MTLKSILAGIFCLLMTNMCACGQSKTIFFCGSANNDLFILLKHEGYSIKRFDSPQQVINAATKGSPVIIVSDFYPQVNTKNNISEDLLNLSNEKRLRLYVEYVSAFPGLKITPEPVITSLERGVITSKLFGDELKPMSLVSINNCHLLPVGNKDPLIVLGKVAGFDKAEYGLDSTLTYPVLFKTGNTLFSTTALSHFATGRYGPTESWKIIWSHILSELTGKKNIVFKSWPSYVSPMYSANATLPANARQTSIKKGVDWFYKGRFFIHPSWEQTWLKYQGDGTKPFGPPVGQQLPNGDGKLGILEGHASTIYYDGKQQYRYWMRADVQGEASMALAAAGDMLNNNDYKAKAKNLGDFVFKTSNMRAEHKNDSTSSAFGLIGWATTHPGVFYGDDNARALLGYIAASAYLKTDQWDKELVEGILSNFRTTGKQGFRGERLEENNIIKNGWEYYWNRDIQHISPHFESWMWACYLWLYDKTHYEPLLTKTKEAIRITMDAYPDNWLWGSSMQTQRARMILPLAWLVRVENTEQHRKWLDIMVNDVMKYQVESGALREEIGKGEGRFIPVKSNKDYGVDEASLIFKNGEPAACMLYTCNFAVFALNEAVHATGNPKYKEAVDKLADFLVRIQVNSKKFNDIDGAWFRAFDYERWDYWASNSDAGWGAWCTLTGWIQSWIVTTLAQIEQKQSYWDLTKKSGVNKHMQHAVHQMFKK
jgi:hypothetical protein